MSSSLEDLFNEVNIQNSLVNGPAEPSAEFTKPQEEYRYQGDIAPTIQDAERIAQSKYNVSSHNALMGTLVSAGVEIGSGIGGTVYATKVMKGMKWANRAKNVALAGVVAPEPVSTVTGAIAFGATEAAIWGFSNFLGQTARKSFGIQDHYSGGEMIAAAVFGTAAATAQGTKLIELAPSLASMKAWKSMPIARETGKAFVTGAGLGVAESLLRQEVQLILNERENRDVMDYMFSGAAGGAFNTVFSVFGRTGAWGLTKAGDAAANARHLAEQKLAQAHKITSKRKRRKEVKKWTEALDHLKEVETSFRGAAEAERDYHKNAPEPEQVNNPSGDPRQAPKLDPLEKPNAPEGDIPSEVDYSDAKLGDTIEIVSVEGKRSQVEVIGISEQSGAIRFKRKDGSEGVTGLTKDSVLNDINSPNYILQSAGHGTQNKNIKDLSDVELDELEAALKAAFKESPSLKNADGEASNRDHQSDLFAIQLEKARRTGKNPEAPETPKDIPEGEAPEAPDTPSEPTPEAPVVENNFKPKKVKAAGDTYPVFELTINGKSLFIGSSDTMGLGRIFHVTDASGMEHLSLSGSKLEGEANISAANDVRDSFETRKELIEALKAKAEKEAPEAPATPKDALEPTTAPVENVITPDKNPNYKQGSGVSRLLGYKVKAKDGRELYIESRAGYGEVPKRHTWLVSMDGEGLDTFPTKKEALDWIDRTNEIKSTPKEAPATPKPDPETPTETPTPPQSPTEEAAPQLTQRQQLIESYKERFRNIKGEPSLARQFAPLQADSNALKTEMDGDFQWRIEDLTAKYQAGEELSEVELDEMLELVSDLRSLNEVDNVLKTTAGRGTQANRSDAAKYVNSTDLSLRAIREDAALFDMEETLQKLRRGEKVPSMEEQFDKFLSTKDSTNKLNAAIYANKDLTPAEMKELGVTPNELKILQQTARSIQTSLKTLTRQLEKERAKMMDGMKLAMNGHQKDKLAEEVKKRMKENPSIRMLEQQIKYYKDADVELTQLKDAQAELARLASIEGEGNMTQLRNETEVKDRVAKAPSELSKVRKKIAESKTRMRQKLKEIDKAQEEIDNPVSFAEKRVSKLEKELQKLREIRSGTRKPDSPKTPESAKTDKEIDLEARIKFYKDEVREIKQLETKEAELDRLIKLETEGSLGQIRDEFETKPEIVGKPTGKISDINKKIADAKSRMRSKLKDIDRANAEMDKFDLFLSMQSYTMRNIEADASNKFVQFGRDVRAARRLALIDQLPSVLAGVPTGVGLAMRSAVRPFAMAPLDFARYGGDTAKKLFAAEIQGLATTILNWNGTATSMGRTFQRGSSATDQVMSKYLEESTHKAIRMGNRPSVDRAMKTAEARMKKQKDPMNTILDFRNNGGWSLLSLGVRGIGAIDDGFRRQILRGRLETAARRKAIMEHPSDPKLAEEAYNNYMKTMWKDQNGLQVLSNYKEFINDVNDINQNLLFAAQHDNPDLFHQNMGEQLISKLSEAAKGDTGLAYLVDAFMPYISVPIRGVYRGVRFAAAPVVGAKAASPLNPYTQKINERMHTIETAQFGMMKLKEGDAEFKQLADDIKNAQTEIQILKEREIKYKEDAMVDTAFGVGLATLGMSAAALGEATGSLNWMSKDQKEKNKLKPFQMFGMDYSAAAPWSIPIAIGADIFQYVKAREAGVLEEKQNVAFMLSATVADMAEQVPMMQGFQTFNSIISGGMETKTKLVGRMAAGYIPLPAQVRKTVMAGTEDGTVGDLRGGTFGQRTAYAFFGIKPVNRKTDYFGEDVQSGKTWLQHAVIRQAPSKDQGLNTEFERVLASDAFDNIQAVPSSLGHRMKMTSFVDEEGVTLQYAYARRLREHRKFYKGKKRTLKQAVNHLIRSSKWRKKHRESTISKSLQHNNEGLRELNKLMQDYYFDVRQSIIKDDNFTKRFVNHRDENLYDLVRRKETKILGNTRPIRELLQAN